MQLLLLLVAVSVVAGAPAVAPNARYFIQAEEAVWDYAAQGTNVCQGRDFDDVEAPYVQATDGFVGSKVKKALYRGYTDKTFKKYLPVSAADRHAGMLGPVIRATVGNIIAVVFRNNLDFPVNLHVGAGVDQVISEGIEDPAVQPGDTVTYTWHITADAGPGPNDPSSIMWLYRSTVDTATDLYSGLLGPLIVTNSKPTLAGLPLGVDRELITVFWVNNELGSHYAQDNYDTYADKSLGEELPEDNEDFSQVCPLPPILVEYGFSVGV